MNAPAHWIGIDPLQVTDNLFIRFRRTITLDEVPSDTLLRLAAVSTARLWINGHLLCRKTTRCTEKYATADTLNANVALRPGANVIVVQLHYWGNIITFQRTGNHCPGLYLDADWLKSDESWRYEIAPEFLRHSAQIVGRFNRDRRLRFPLVLDTALQPDASLHEPGFDDSGWAQAQRVTDAPWPEQPQDVETPLQEEFFTPPASVLAAGILTEVATENPDPLSIAPRLRDAVLQPNPGLHATASLTLPAEHPFRLETVGGQSFYLTVDFGRPVHGYPLLQWEASTPVTVDWGYAELATSLYDGRQHVRADGWLDSEAVAGFGYADRTKLAVGKGEVELPDERTARWMTLHLHFQEAGSLVLHRLGLVESQYPIVQHGSFRCGHDRIEQIVALALVHARVTMTDAYVDTPGREDGQWLEDARSRARLAERWYGDHRLRRLLLRLHAESQGEEGHFHPFAPSNYPFPVAPLDWSVQWVGTLYDDYRWTGETALISRFWPNLQRYWGTVLQEVRADGLWMCRHLLQDIRVSAALQEGQSSGMITPWIIGKLRASVEMARAIAENEAGDQWQEIVDRMTDAYRRHHLVPASEDKPLHVGDRTSAEVNGNKATQDRGCSQPSQIGGVTSGLLTADEARAVMDWAFPDPEGSPPEGMSRWNNPTWSRRALESLSRVGRSARAVRHLLERYAPYLPAHPRNPTPLIFQGALGGPLPEYWISREDEKLGAEEINPRQPEDATGSHGWGAVPLLWLHEWLLGVRLKTAGGAEVLIAPEAAGLPFVEGWTVTPKGKIWVSWHPQTGLLEIELPAGIQAELKLPHELPLRRLKISGTAPLISENETSIQLNGPGNCSVSR